MPTKVTTKITTTEATYLSVDEIEDILRTHHKKADHAVVWDVTSYGDIRGCTITTTNVQITEHTLEDLPHD